MKISLDWLSEHVEVNSDPSALADLLTMAGLEVESVERIGGTLDGVVVGSVIEAGRHPNADRLSLCKVDVGNPEPLQIVCGAPNVSAGQKVAVATIGSTITVPDQKQPGRAVALKIKRSKIRGEYSEGMICAEDELGVGEDHDGILVLQADAPVGAPVRDVLVQSGQPVGDVVLDIAITPNRPDATSHVGVARDVAALTKAELRTPQPVPPSQAGSVEERVSVVVEAPNGCPRFAAMVVEGVNVVESPKWMQARLRAVGLRPRNNVVDITNYVMLELGQPLHAYDLDKLVGEQIVVRESKSETRFVTLDEKERTVPVGTMMVWDGEREIGIGGVMGGMNTEVSDDTTRVLVEGAYWNPAMIRRTSKQLGLQTDASYRFERGVDSAGQARAVARAGELIAETGGGVLVDGMIHVGEPDTRRTVTLRLSQIERHLGLALPHNEVSELLTAIGFGISVTDDPGVIACAVPTFRPDVEREIDIIEEVARLRGYASFPMPEATRVPNFAPEERLEDQTMDALHSVLVGAGYREIFTNSLISEDTAGRFQASELTGLLGKPVVTVNAITSEMTTLRPSLLAGALPVLQFNANRGQDLLRFFETGNVFATNPQDTSGAVAGYSERTDLLLVAAGPKRRRSFDDAPDNYDYYDVKGAVQSIARKLRIDIAFSDTLPDTKLFEAGQMIVLDGNNVGFVGQLSAEIANEFGVNAPVNCAELDLSAIIASRSRERVQYQATSRHPVVERDLAVVVSKETSAGHLLKTTLNAGGKLMRGAEIFDVYEGKGIPSGQKSVAISMRFGSDRTLTDGEVDAAVANVVSALQKRHAGELRA